MVKPVTHIAIFWLLFIASAHAQVVEWSNQQKIKSKTNYSRVIGENPTGLYLMRGRTGDLSRDVVIEKYKSNLALEKSEEINLPYNAYVEGVLLQDAGLLVISSQRNDSLPKIDLLCTALNSQLQPTGKIRTLDQIESALFKQNTSILVKSSRFNNQFAILYFTEGVDRKTSVMHLLGYDAQMNQTYRKSFPLPYEPDDIDVNNFECDHEGNAFILVNFPSSTERKKDKKIRNHYLYTFFKSQDKTLEYEVKQDSTFINDIDLALNPVNKTVLISGIYSLEADNQAYGTFTYSIDIASTLLQYKNYEPFAKAFVTKITGTMLNETKPVLTDIRIRKTIPHSNGGTTIILEKYYEARQTYTYYANGFPQTASRVTYNFDEIIVVLKNAQGQTTFQDFIKKNQSSTNDGGYYSSFVLLNTNKRLCFVYSSNANEEGDVMITTIDPNGAMDTKILIKAMSYYVQLMPIESRQISSNSSIICTLKDRRFTLMKLTY